MPKSSVDSSCSSVPDLRTQNLIEVRGRGLEGRTCGYLCLTWKRSHDLINRMVVMVGMFGMVVAYKGKVSG